MEQVTNGPLMQYTMAAKAIIYNADRLRALIKLIMSKPGAITAVHTVMQSIQLKKPIPPELAPMLSVNIYIMLADAAYQVTGVKPDPAIMQGVIKDLISSVKSPAKPTSPQIKSAPPAQGGLIANAMGA